MTTTSSWSWRGWLAGVRVRELPPDLPYPRNAAPSAGDVLVDIQDLGGGSLLWVHVTTGWTKSSFAKDRVEVQCYDPSGALRWSVEASNVMAQSPDNSLQLLVDAIGAKLKQHRGDPCMVP